MRLKPKTAQALRVLSGRVWVTQDGDLTDYFLSPGDSIALNAGRTWVLEAQNSAARVELGNF